MTVIITNPLERTRFLKFVVVGAFGFVVDLSVANMLSLAQMSLTKTPPTQASVVIPGTISFICAVTSNFIWNRFWTYPESRSKPVLGQLGQFALVNGAGFLLIRLPIMNFGEPLLDGWLSNFVFSATTHQLISGSLTLVFAIVLVMMWNFFVNRYWTYNDIDSKS